MDWFKNKANLFGGIIKLSRNKACSWQAKPHVIVVFIFNKTTFLTTFLQHFLSPNERKWNYWLETSNEGCGFIVYLHGNYNNHFCHCALFCLGGRENAKRKNSRKVSSKAGNDIIRHAFSATCLFAGFLCFCSLTWFDTPVQQEQKVIVPLIWHVVVQHEWSDGSEGDQCLQLEFFLLDAGPVTWTRLVLWQNTGWPYKH